MRARLGAVAWFITGAALGFGGLALSLASLGALMLLPALAIGGVLTIFRICPASMLLVGAGVGIAVPWSLHVASGDTPDRELWPLFVGGVLIATGLMFFRRNQRSDATRASRPEWV